MKRFFTFLILAFFGGSAVFAYTPDEISDLKYNANRGDKTALARLGEIYERGDGVSADEKIALYYYLAAFKRDPKNQSVRERVIALGGERFLPGSGGISGKKLLADLGGGVKLELLQVPAGAFTMGSPSNEDGRYGDDENQVSVRITKPFYLGKTEVTQAQWKALMGNNPSHFKGDNLPVECVSWNDAMAFCNKLTSREHAAGRLPRNWRYTLPTEAQWEYACRAGTTTRFCSGNSESALSKVAWWDGNSGGETRSVGTKSPNAWGFYDMHGNVWEWCSDWYASSLRVGNDPVGAQSGSDRVGRGGSWGRNAQFCRSAFRCNISPVFRYYNLGFRVAAVQTSNP